MLRNWANKHTVHGAFYPIFKSFSDYPLWEVFLNWRQLLTERLCNKGEHRWVFSFLGNRLPFDCVLALFFFLVVGNFLFVKSIQDSALFLICFWTWPRNQLMCSLRCRERFGLWSYKTHFKWSLVINRTCLWISKHPTL